MVNVRSPSFLLRSVGQGRGEEEEKKNKGRVKEGVGREIGTKAFRSCRKAKRLTSWNYMRIKGRKPGVGRQQRWLGGGSGWSNYLCCFLTYFTSALLCASFTFHACVKPHLYEQFFLDKFTLTRKNCSFRWRIVGKFSLSRKIWYASFSLTRKNCQVWNLLV